MNTAVTGTQPRPAPSTGAATPASPSASGLATGPATTPMPAGASRPNVLSLSIKDQAGLYAAYMPFLSRGGIFVPSNRPFRLGEQVFLVLSLLDRQKFQVAGEVAWITPAGTPLKTPGVGVHLPDDDNGRNLKRAVEEILGKAIESGRPTQTL